MATDATTEGDAGWRGAAFFLALFLALYAALAAIAEFRVGRGGADSAFQKILAARGSEVDWIVLGASHALPLAYGDVPARHAAATGETMLVLAEPGAGPVYAGFVARQALRDLRPRRVLWILDPFTFQSRAWNADRVEDRGLLRTTPLRPSTARLMAAMVVSDGVDARALLDYLTLFSKLNNPRRFDPGGVGGRGRLRPRGAALPPCSGKPHRVSLSRWQRHGAIASSDRRIRQHDRRVAGGGQRSCRDAPSVARAFSRGSAAKRRPSGRIARLDGVAGGDLSRPRRRAGRPGPLFRHRSPEP